MGLRANEIYGKFNFCAVGLMFFFIRTGKEEVIIMIAYFVYRITYFFEFLNIL